MGGIKRHGESYYTFEALQDALLARFTLIHRQDVPFVIRETDRKYQHSLSDMTIWQKTSK